MSDKKSSRLDVIEKKVNSLINVVTSLRDELEHVATMAIGTMKLLKNFSEFDEAIEKLKGELETEVEEEKKLEL